MYMYIMDDGDFGLFTFTGPGCLLFSLSSQFNPRGRFLRMIFSYPFLPQPVRPFSRRLGHISDVYSMRYKHFPFALSGSPDGSSSY